MKKQIAILGIILLLVCVGLSGCTNSDNDGGSADTITPTGNYDIDYRGIKIYVHSLAWNDWLDESDWERFASCAQCAFEPVVKLLAAPVTSAIFISVRYKFAHRLGELA